MLTDTQLRTLWGDLFEIAVKRGCLGVLRQRGLLGSQADHLRPWRRTRVADLHGHLLHQTGAVDPRERARLRASLDHVLLAGWGLGWTVMRECLRRLGPQGRGEALEITGVYCPLTLPDRRSGEESDPEERVAALWEALSLDGAPPSLRYCPRHWWPGRALPSSPGSLGRWPAGSPTSACTRWSATRFP